MWICYWTWNPIREHWTRASSGHKSLWQQFFLIISHYHLNGFYWRHQCSWTLIKANCIQVFIMQSDDCNRKKPSLWQGLKLLWKISMGWTEEYSGAYLQQIFILFILRFESLYLWFFHRLFGLFVSCIYHGIVKMKLK